MDSFKVEITGDRDVGVRLDAFPGGLYDELVAAIHQLGTELYPRIVAATPDRTGKLRSEERLRFFADKNRISARVDIAAGGTEAAKAGALEYGAHRATHVRAHRMRLDHAWAEKLAETINVLVSAYTRTPDIAERRFERGPLAEMQPEILARLNQVVEQGAAKANR